MKKMLIVTVAAISAGFIGCHQSSRNASPQPVTIAATDSVRVTIPTSGAVVMTSQIQSMEIQGAGANNELFATHQELGSRAAQLRAITSVAKTDAGNFDFYAGENLTLRVAANPEGQLIIVDSVGALAVESIAYVAMGHPEQAQELATGHFDFVLSSCITAQVAQVDQEQVQEKEPTVKEECATITVLLQVLEQRPVIEDKDDKEKEEPKAQEPQAPKAPVQE